MNKITCARCKGTGVLTITAQVLKEDKFVAEPPVTIDCVFCNGTGKRSQVSLDAENEFWCQCDNPSGHSDYHPDEGGMKHHYTCQDCGRVTQVG